MLLVKNAEIYAPEYLGKKDLLICGGKIECIQDSIRELPVECEVLDAEGKILTPGFLDQHVHITGVLNLDFVSFLFPARFHILNLMFFLPGFSR